MKKIWLYIFDYEFYDFQKLDEDLHSSNSGYCFKQYYGQKRKTKKEIENLQNECLKKGDVLYIRFKNMPDNISRILLKLEVQQVKDEKGNFLCEQDKDGYYHRYCLLGGIGKIKWIYNEDDYKFSMEKLRSNYKLPTNYKCEITNNEKLINDLKENEYSYTELKYKMMSLKTCEFTNYKPKREHETFTTASGLCYREGHHFVHQAIYYNCTDELLKEKLSKLIYNETNNILLCPLCHREIHNGKPQEVIKMIKYLLYNVDGLKDNTQEIAKLLNKTTEQLISEMYKVDFKI